MIKLQLMQKRVKCQIIHSHRYAFIFRGFTSYNRWSEESQSEGRECSKVSVGSGNGSDPHFLLLCKENNKSACKIYF